jgi:hypothetical protein
VLRALRDDPEENAETEEDPEPITV